MKQTKNVFLDSYILIQHKYEVTFIDLTAFSLTQFQILGNRRLITSRLCFLNLKQDPLVQNEFYRNFDSDQLYFKVVNFKASLS